MNLICRSICATLALGLFVTCSHAGEDAATILKGLKDRGAEVTLNMQGEVTELRLYNRVFSNDDLAKLQTFPSLKWLVLGESFTEDGLKHLARLDSLEVLFARVMKISPMGLKHLQAMKSLNYLALRKDFMNEQGVRLLLEHGLAHKLETVDGNGKLGRPDTVDDVTDIRLATWDLSDDGLKVLKSFKSLSRIYTDRDQFTDGYARSLRELNLLHMVYDMDGNNYRPKSNADVSSLRLMSHVLTEKGFKEFAVFTSLKSLALYETRLNDSAMKTVVESMKSLESLALGPSMTDEALKELPSMPTLKKLYFHEGFSMTDAGMKTIAQIKTLEALNLSGVSVTPGGIANLKGLKLSAFTMRRDQINDEILRELRKSDLLHKLNWANGRNGRPTGMNDIRFLNLHGSNLTDAGLRELEEMTLLERVFLSQTKVTDEGVAKLKKALPNVKVMR
jgi:hypothetical protein